MKKIAAKLSLRSRFLRAYPRHWPVALALSVGLAATLIVVFVVWHSDAQNYDAEQSEHINSRIKTISAELLRYEDLVKAAQAYAGMSGQGILDRNDYKNVISHLLRDREGIQALDYAPRVPASERMAFEARARSEGLIDFRITEGHPDGHVKTAGDRADYFPIYDLYPVEGNEVALGLNAPVGREAIFDLARDSGLIVASMPIRLYDKSTEWSLLLVGPVYETLAENTVNERRVKIKGYVIGVFRVGVMFESILQHATFVQGFDHYIFDGPPNHRGQLIYTHASRLRGPADPVPSLANVRASDAHIDSLSFDQHEWTVVTVPLGDWRAQMPELDVLLSLIVGLAGTGIGTLYVFATRRRASFLDTLTTELAESQDRLQTIFSSVTEGIFVSDPMTGAFIEVNRSGCELFGYERDDLIGRRIIELSADGSPQALSTVLERLKNTMSGKSQSFEWQVRTKDGHLFWAEISLSCVPFGRKTVALATLRDITERRQIQADLIVIARKDALTGLANRSVFVDAVQHAISRARRDEHLFAVLYLDLDHFKDVNDTLGHAIGDLLLKAVAGRLRTHVREIDAVGRFGGDEFAVLAAELREPTDAGVVAMKILDALREPFMIQGNRIRSTTSIGIAIFDVDSPVLETLLSHADLAMYRAKLDGGNRYKFFTDSMDLEVRERVSLAEDLRNAIATESLCLVYQPQVEIESGNIIGVEALVRWRHPSRGMLTPEHFIPAAEKSGLIIELGRWILREACRQAKAWFDEGIDPIVIGVNFSAIQLKAPLALENEIVTTLAETRLPAHWLEIELTETALMVASREHNDVLQRIHDSGVRLAIDDFGTGYSSLDYLRRYPVDRIKIAQTFVADITTDLGDVAIVKATIGLARELKINLMAEGVETEEQRDLLIQWGCLEAQGFYFSQPLCSDDVKILLRAGKIARSRRRSLAASVH